MDAMLRAVWAAPSDDHPRLVLADSLQESGDPWGEFIAIQVRRLKGPRLAALSRKLMTRIAGPLAPISLVPLLEFKRGFVSSLTTKGHAPRASWLSAATAPQWATIETANFAPGAPPAFYAQWAANPAIVNLRQITYGTAMEPELILVHSNRQGWRIEHARISGAWRLLTPWEKSLSDQERKRFRRNSAKFLRD